jgi:hypothetical protein
MDIIIFLLRAKRKNLINISHSKLIIRKILDWNNLVLNIYGKVFDINRLLNGIFTNMRVNMLSNLKYKY